VQRAAPVPPGHKALCARCGFRVRRRQPHARQRTLALTLAALLLYVPANALPIVTTTYLGAQTSTTIFDGVRGLIRDGQWPIGALVFTTSILTPGFKIFALLLLALSASWRRFRRLRLWLYKGVQLVDPWNMLEVTLLSILVAIAELGEVATVEPGPGVISFAAVVVLTILATLAFDPRLVYDDGGSG
jgi:paraquat-inducible protein A